MLTIIYGGLRRIYVSKKKVKVKAQAEEMLLQILRYIKAEKLSDKEDYELKVELASSIITAAIDIDFYNKTKTIMNLCEVLDDINNITKNGVLEVLSGEGEYKEI